MVHLFSVWQGQVQAMLKIEPSSPVRL